VIEPSVLHTGVDRVAQQIVHAVHAERVADDHLSEDCLPVAEADLETQALGLARADRELPNVHGLRRRNDAGEDLLHRGRVDDLACEPLVVEAGWEQGILGRVGERKMSHVVAERRHPNHGPPVSVVVLRRGGDRLANRV
jgi:hypothetical protein